jgi:hypothetical protein
MENQCDHKRNCDQAQPMKQIGFRRGEQIRQVKGKISQRGPSFSSARQLAVIGGRVHCVCWVLSARPVQSVLLQYEQCNALMSVN